ncbi:MAG: T9SS type A sorting domain-containing protein, partial [Chitinophagales bacterium]|nr:T9SS type A sorting domain-containing protein [Chitinophagales bacterium]
IPKYQWTRNGTNITGAISNVWGASTLSNNDQICVDMTSGYLCPNPKTAKSNCIKVSIESTGGTNITGIWTGKEPSIYPNPATEKLIIEGIDKGTKIQLTDVLGRVLIKATAASETMELTMSHLASGSYMLTLSKDNGDRMSVKVVKE